MEPTREDFKEQAEEYSCVPLIRDIEGDLDTPVTLMKKIKAHYLLESVNRDGAVGRYSFISRGELCRISLEGDEVEIRRRGDPTRRIHPPHPLNTIQDIIAGYTHPDIAGRPPFLCGFLGYLGYEAVRHWEAVPTHAAGVRGEDPLPDGIWVLPEETLVYDLVSRRITLVVLTVPGKDIDAAYADGANRMEALLAALASPLGEEETEMPPEGTGGAVIPEEGADRKAAFLRSVEACKKAIIAGDLIQGVISRKIFRETTASAEKIYRSLRRLNPSPYLFYLDFGEYQLIGSSPEVMIRVEEGKLLLKPIAGTRRRGKTPQEDAALAEELKKDPKELAEHLMLVDLGRNDLGRVSLPGTVEVTDFQSVETYSHVMHLVSTLVGSLDPEQNIFSLIGAVFPAGTLTGAPKIRAMEYLYDLEGERRGPYGGMVFHMDMRGNLDSCITIRTMVKRGNRVEVQAGAGIVYQSDPEREYEETGEKAAALLKALEEAEK